MGVPMLAVPLTTPACARASTPSEGQTTAPKIVALEVAVLLPETEEVEKVVHHTVVIEDVEHLLLVARVIAGLKTRAPP